MITIDDITYPIAVVGLTAITVYTTLIFIGWAYDKLRRKNRRLPRRWP